MTEISEAAKLKARELITADWGVSSAAKGTGAHFQTFARFIQQVSDVAKEVVEQLPEGTSCAIFEDLGGFILPDPVDPLLIEAREIVAKWWEDNPAKDRFAKSCDPDEIRRGNFDGSPEMVQALTALKRGMELAGGQP